MWLALLLAACSGDDEPAPTPTADTAATVPAPVRDVFVQTILTPIDILWVIDPSWTDGRVALDEAIDDGMETLLLADPSWRMGVMSADTSVPQSRGVITEVFETWPPPPDARPFDLFPPAGPARVREALYIAFGERLERNEDFLRPEASLYVLVFTEGEDQTASDILDEVEFVDWFEALELTQDKRMGVLTTRESGPAWRQLTNTTGGTVFEVGGFKRGLETLLLDAMTQEREFRLSRIPASPPEEVIVVYRERGTVYEIGEDYSFFPDSNKIVFDRYVPPPGAEIRVEYFEYVEGAEPTDTASE